ncbi:MAG: winged helix-turn-helix transcriptional regulator [Candidatus Thorarchaeota archaeon]
MQLPRSAYIVLSQLAKDGPLCPIDISERSNLAPRTVSYALRRLTSTKLCKKVPNLRDMRRPLYSPNFDEAREVVQRLGADSLIGSQLTIILRR